MSDEAKGRYADEAEPPQQGEEEEGPPEEYRVLFAAAEYGRADIVASAAKSLQEKLEAPGDPVDLGRVLGDATNDAGARLLEVACDHGKVDAVRALLRVGAYPPVAAPAASAAPRRPVALRLSAAPARARAPSRPACRRRSGALLDYGS